MIPGRAVTDAELFAHVEAWPRPLERDVYAVYEPPLITYNDFSFGLWPESVVCFYHASGYDCPPSHWTIVRELTMGSQLEDAERKRIVDLAMAALLVTPTGTDDPAHVTARRELIAILHKLAGVDVRVIIER